LAEDAEQQAQARVGCVLDDKWTLERLLGLGGMAAVYSARHRNGARAAVKVLHSDLSRLKDVRERFLREGYAANRVEHPGAVKVLDDDVVASGPESGTAYLVMELLEGESLQDRLERGPPVGELEYLTIAGSVLEVLEAAHTRGVVHRDLKPENLFLARSERPSGADRVKVLDFGLARLVQGQAITSYGLALGTPSFMSPEQAAGRIDEIDGRTDLFALAATGFRICAGRRIHEGANPVELVRKMASVAAPRVRDVRPEVSAPCARVIDRALEFRREDRYESASAMREDVRRAIAELQASGPTQLALEPPPSLAPRPAPSAPPSDEQRTVELSASDLREPSEYQRPAERPMERPTAAPPVRAATTDRPTVAPPVRAAVAAAPPPAAATAKAVASPFARSPDETEESIHIPRRRSVLPWLLAIAVVGVGGKLWFAHRAPVAPELPVLPVATAASSAPEAPAPDASAQVPAFTRDHDAGAEVAKPASSTAAATAPKSLAATHRAPAGKVGPGNVHKLPHKHHAKKPTTGRAKKPQTPAPRQG
jgi:serine/threonine-protein kinase